MAQLNFDNIDSKKRVQLLINFFLIVSLLILFSSLIFSSEFEKYGVQFVSALSPPCILAISLYLLQQWRYYKHVHSIFHDSKFSARPKRIRIDNPPIRELKTFQNRIIYRISNKKGYEGEFVINPLNLRYADGYHNVLPEEGQGRLEQDEDLAHDDMFGFTQAIVTEKKIFLEHPYIMINEKWKAETSNRTSNGTVVYNASIWERIEELKE